MTFLLSYDFSTLSEESHLENPQMKFFWNSLLIYPDWPYLICTSRKYDSCCKWFCSEILTLVDHQGLECCPLKYLSWSNSIVRESINGIPESYILIVKSNIHFLIHLARRAKSLHCSDLARLACVEKSIVGKNVIWLLPTMLFSDSVENFRHCRKKA